MRSVLFFLILFSVFSCSETKERTKSEPPPPPKTLPDKSFDPLCHISGDTLYLEQKTFVVFFSSDSTAGVLENIYRPIIDSVNGTMNRSAFFTGRFIRIDGMPKFLLDCHDGPVRSGALFIGNGNKPMVIFGKMTPERAKKTIRNYFR